MFRTCQTTQAMQFCPTLTFSPNRYGLGFSPQKKGGPRRQRGWAPVGLRFMFSWVGRGDGAGFSLGSLHVSFLGSWVGWVGRGQEAGLSLGSLHTSFLGGWVGWVGRGQRAGLPLGSLHVSSPGSDGWVLGRMGGPRQRSWASIGHISFLGSWVGWVGHCQEAGLSLGSLHVSFFLGSWVAWVADGWAAAKKLGFHWLPSCRLGRMGGPRPRSWAPVGFPSCFFLSFWVLGRMGEAGLPLYFLSG